MPGRTRPDHGLSASGRPTATTTDFGTLGLGMAPDCSEPAPVARAFSMHKFLIKILAKSKSSGMQERFPAPRIQIRATSCRWVVSFQINGQLLMQVFSGVQANSLGKLKYTESTTYQL